MDEENSIAIIIISLLFSAFFSAGESAFITANKLYFEIRIPKKETPFYIKSLGIFFKKPSLFLTTTLLGNTVALVVYGIFIAKLLEPYISKGLERFIINEATLDTFVLFIQTIISTLLVLATAEFLPKRIAMLKPENSLKTIGFPMRVIYTISFPVIYLIEVLTSFFMKKVVSKENSSIDNQANVGLKDLDNYIGNAVTSEGKKLEINHTAFQTAIEFLSTEVGDCLIPRLEIGAIDIEDLEDLNNVGEQLLAAFETSGHSKIILYKEHLDQILGYCHIRSLLKKQVSLEEIIQDIFYVPETMTASALLLQFRTERKSIAVVVDEFGGTSGIITPEDLAEEIVGEIEDEHDTKATLPIKRIDSHTYELSARVEIDFLNTEYGEKYNWHIPRESEYDTLGGFIFSTHGKLPKKNEIVKAKKFTFKILEVKHAHIKYVLMKVERS